MDVLIEMQNAVFLQITCLLLMYFCSENVLVIELFLLTKVTTNMNDLAVPIAQFVQLGGQQLQGDIAS